MRRASSNLALGTIADPARVVEQEDTRDLKSLGQRAMRVRLPPRAPSSACRLSLPVILAPKSDAWPVRAHLEAEAGIEPAYTELQSAA